MGIYELGGIFFPPKCIACSVYVANSIGLCPDCWGKVTFINQGEFCMGCGLESAAFSEENSLCSLCFEDPPYYSKSASVAKYGDVIDRLIFKLKFGDSEYVAKFCANLMFNLCKSLFRQAGLIIPVPLSVGKLRSRKYNQSAVIAKRLGVLSGIDVDVSFLTKIIETPSQTKLGMNLRKNNLKGAFRSFSKREIAGKTIILVDDVITTGATANNCAKVIKKSGALEVRALSFGRTLK